MRARVHLLTLVMLMLFMVLVVRLFYWQIVRGSQLQKLAENQQQTNLIISGKRGEIYDRNGEWLVSKATVWTVYANPKKVDNQQETAKKLTDIFLEHDNKLFEIDDEYRYRLNEESRIKELLSKTDLFWVPLKSRVDDQIKKKIEDLEIAGIGFEEEETRFYPESSSAAHLLGFLGKDEKGEILGYFGLEGYYEDSLSGKQGYIRRESDVSGIPLLFGDLLKTGAVEGIDLYTSIDKSVQKIIEDKLLEGIQRYGAKDGTAIVMDPKSGNVLAMASYPSYDPQKYFLYSDELFINPSISRSFEPGSVFKIIVMASALDAGVVEPDSKCDICNKAYRIGKYYIETWDGKYYPDSSMTDVIVHSDNVGMTFVGLRLGRENMYDYLTKFGIGRSTGIDLQGESSPALRDKDQWGEIELATASFGQGVAVTPIQMISAAAVIANKGIKVSPKVVKKFKRGDWLQENTSTKPERVISEKAAGQITAMMVEAAKKGEAKWTYKGGFGVAGKTGTAQIPIQGHYDQEKTIASFVGFAPFDDPEFIMLVTLNQPQTSPWASETAAPLWYDIAADLFLYFNVMPTQSGG